MRAYLTPTVRSLRAMCIAALLCVGAGLVAAQGTGTDAVRLAGIFGDHMVLQRDQPVRVWGFAPAGAAVRVGFRGASRLALADAAGRWRVDLPPGPAGGPHELTLQGQVALRDVLLGDVWLCTGQSNMEWTLGQSDGAVEAVAAADLPLIRHVKIARRATLAPQDDLPVVRWQVSSPVTAAEFSGVGFYFARRLQRDQKVPIGLVNLAWGGTHLETWTRREALAEDPAIAPLLQGLPDSLPAWLAWQRARTQAVLDRWQPGLPAITGVPSAQDQDADPSRWASLDHADGHWPTLQVPQVWEEQGLDGLDGVVWYRREVVLDAAQAAMPATLHLGAIDDCDETWVNGRPVGKTCVWDQPRHYTLPVGTLREGRNLVAVRVTDTGGAGGFHGDSAAVQLQLGAARLPLAGPWKARVETGLDKPEPSANDLPSLLHNGMVQPLVPLRIRGAIWYQGESNVGRAAQYVGGFQRLITDLRRQWGQGAFPFYFVQLASFLPLERNDPNHSPWAELRDAQRQALALPNTGMAVATDVGNANDIHPRNKRAVGERLALHALRAAGLPAPPPNGPVFTGLQLRGGRAVLSLRSDGLRTDAPGAALRGFSIADASQRFRPAQARIEGRRVVVWHPEVKQPVAVRFGWVDNPEQDNLFDRHGLPASPFRTDDWPWVTAGQRCLP
ncbi:MAG: sialate O-acetylesterase [Ideonella sp.]|nr:sialate O-acetylesterase [Ideonella sp.]